MCAQLIMIVVVIAFDGGVFDRPVDPLDLAVGPWMAGPGQPVFNPVGVADHVKAHGPGIDRVSVPWLRGEPDAIIGQDRVDVIRDGFEQMFKELPGCLAVGLVYELSDRRFSGPINGCEQLQPVLGGLDLGDVHVEAPDWIALETLPLWCVPFDVRQARYAMPLQAPMQGRPCQARD